MVSIGEKRSRAPPLTYEIWPHLIAEKERKEGKALLDLRIKRKYP